MNKNKTKYFFIGICLAVSSSLVGMDQQPEFNPNNAKFAFDFHGVVATEPFTSFSDIRKIFRWDIVPTCNVFIPSFIIQTVALLLYGPTGESFRNLCIKCQQHQMVEGITRIANDFIVIDDTVKLMRELKDLGYELDMVSNIDSLFLHALETDVQYKYVQENILSLFTHKISTDWVDAYPDCPIRKPDIRYFKSYQQKYNPDKKNIIFIDDRPANIATSKKVDMISIQFHSSEQLRNELVRRGILK